MIKVSVFYPRVEGATFDLDYYLTKHLPMVQDRLGAALKGYSVDVGLSGATPDSPPPYVAASHLLFDSVEEGQAAFAQHNDEISRDVANYTTIKATFQISEVKQ